MTIDHILNRRSIRSYTEDEITDDQLELLLKAGLSAPSAKNRRPFEFVAIRNRETLDALSGVCVWWTMLTQAPLAIAVVANVDEQTDADELFHVQDCSAATENILIAAECIGLGAVWLGLYNVQERIDGVRAVLKLPGNIIPISLISIGVPKSHPEPHTGFDSSKVHYEVY
jgi:nitroreductase